MINSSLEMLSGDAHDAYKSSHLAETWTYICFIIQQTCFMHPPFGQYHVRHPLNNRTKKVPPPLSKRERRGAHGKPQSSHVRSLRRTCHQPILGSQLEGTAQPPHPHSRPHVYKNPFMVALAGGHLLLSLFGGFTRPERSDPWVTNSSVPFLGEPLYTKASLHCVKGIMLGTGGGKISEMSPSSRMQLF